MPFASGSFTLYSPGNPVVTATTISSTWANSTLTDIGTGLSTCVLKDGSQTMTANLPMGNFKITGLAAPTLAGDALAYGSAGALSTLSLGTIPATAGTLRLPTSTSIQHRNSTDNANLSLLSWDASNNYVFGSVSAGNIDILAATTSFSGVGTTASAANAFLDNAASPANRLLRSTSSIRYKTDVQDVTSGDVAAAMKLRPVTYRSKAEADDPNRRWFGFIAEEAHKEQPMLVTYTLIDGESVPDGFQYERLVVALFAEVKTLRAEVEKLTQP